MTRSGSITLGLLIGLTAGALVVGAGGGWYASSKVSGAQHATELQAAQDETQALAAELGECQARVTAESLQAAAAGTTDALGAALAPDLAEVALRTQLVQGLQARDYTAALLEVASPQLIAAEAAMTRCAALTVEGDSSRLGCSKEVVEAWAEAVAALPDCPTTPAPDPADPSAASTEP